MGHEVGHRGGGGGRGLVEVKQVDDGGRDAFDWGFGHDEGRAGGGAAARAARGGRRLGQATAAVLCSTTTWSGKDVRMG